MSYFACFVPESLAQVVLFRLLCTGIAGAEDIVERNEGHDVFLIAGLGLFCSLERGWLTQVALCTRYATMEQSATWVGETLSSLQKQHQANNRDDAVRFVLLDCVVSASDSRTKQAK